MTHFSESGERFGQTNILSLLITKEGRKAYATNIYLVHTMYMGLCWMLTHPITLIGHSL